MATGFGLAPPTRGTSLAVDLNQLDHDLGNLLQPGLYRWGVLLVQVAPYQRLAFWVIHTVSASTGPTDIASNPYTETAP
ncbi:MAG: hypothetical protein R2851_00970 [Caldilineaceae bacterium]